ncbi:MAG: hypothetical protein QG619_1088 [Pseudomonadota bacterium]|nr:hypothetical protein [Pseudomonadota bacterium]
MGRQLSPACLVLIVGLLTASQPAAAWNAAGHRLSAAIAWRLMSQPLREGVGKVLANHPDHAVWLKRSSTLDPAYAAFLEASTWPDDIKRDKRFHDADEAETPLLPGFSDMARHRNWHHVDHPLGPSTKRERSNGELDTRLADLIENVGSDTAGNDQRAISLSWLIHLVADMHQPLHVVSRYNEEGQSDDGGNAFSIDNPFHPRRRSMTLHSYWDDLPGPPWLRGQRLEAAASSLMTLEKNPPTAGTIRQWINESRQLAENVAYSGLNEETPTLTASYHEKALQTARERVALAGKRLALLLEKLLIPASVPRGTLNR